MLRRRRGMNPLLIDLGVPRDIEPGIDRMSGVIVYHIDDLQSFVKEQLGRREREIPRVERIVSEETARFISWSDSLRAQRTIEDLRSKFEELRDGTLEKWRGKLNAREQKIADGITHDLVNKILHEPTINLKGCELETGVKKCETCEMFEEGRGCIHGHQGQEMKCIITRNLFGLQDPAAARELLKWRNSHSETDGDDETRGGDVG
jgi:glutamyl-tRNA reductase